MTILVTGAGGLLGRHLTALPGTTGLDHATLDICAPEAVDRALDELSPTVVINAAAAANVDACERDPLLAWRVNAAGVDLLARATARRGLRLLHLSTDYVLGGDSPRLAVDAPHRPLGVYARSKLGGEMAAHAWGATVVRLQWLYAAQASGFVGRALQRMAAGERVPLVTDQIGSPTPAALAAQWLLQLAAMHTLPATLHLATRGEATPMRWVCALAESQGIVPQWRPITRAELPGARRPARSCLGVTETEALLGQPMPDWLDALRATCA